MSDINWQGIAIVCGPIVIYIAALAAAFLDPCPKVEVSEDDD